MTGLNSASPSVSLRTNLLSSLVVRVSDLSAGWRRVGERARAAAVIHDVRFTIHEHERVALIGGSGHGKSTLARALCGYSLDLQVLAGSVRHYGFAPHVGYIFQNPYGCLNPAMRIGTMLSEQLRIADRRRGDGGRSRSGDYTSRALALLRQLDFAEPELQLRRLPHQLSRGMCQRIAIALNMVIRPRLLICDEPTSALDSEAEQQVCRVLRATEIARALLFITHNIRLATTLCNRILVLENGRIVDDFPAAEVSSLRRSRSRAIGRGRAPATLEHIGAADPAAGYAGARRPAGAADPAALAPLIRLQGVSFAYRNHQVLRDISLTIGRHDSFGIVGRSGSGKSTLLRVLIALLRPQAGEYLLNGQPLWQERRRRAGGGDEGGGVRISGNSSSGGGDEGGGADRRAMLLALRRQVQIIFQDPGESLSPLQSIEEIVAEPLRLQPPSDKNGSPRRGGSAQRRRAREEQARRVRALFDEVGLARALLPRHAHELSVGQQQRVLIARALALSPALLLADEPFSALDSRTQSRLIDFLQQLQRERRVSVCVVTHRPEVLAALSRHHYRLVDGRLAAV